MPRTLLVADRRAASARVGGLYALGAFGIWGVVPVYFKAVAHVQATEVLAHRILWAAVCVAAYLASRGRLTEVSALRRQPRHLATLGLTAAIVAVNWLVFIYAVATDRILQASLGYYINPLFNVLLGVVFLRERLRLLQGVSVLLALLGVANLVLSMGELPWIALVLAVSFGTYGLLRKITPVRPVVGMLVESVLLAPLAFAYLAWLLADKQLAFAHGASTMLLLAAAGPVTAVPLIFFAAAAHRLTLTTVGFFQYLTPTGQFLLAVLFYGEAFTRTHATTFACIWIALALYSYDAWRRAKRQVRQPLADPRPGARAQPLPSIAGDSNPH